MPPRMIEVNDGYAVMPKIPRPASPRPRPPAQQAPTPPVAPQNPPADDTPRNPASQQTPVPIPRPTVQREYVDGTLDIPRGGRGRVTNTAQYRWFVQPRSVPAELIVAAQGNPLAQDMLLAYRHEGIPNHIDAETWLSRFALYGRDEDADSAAKQLMSLLGGNVVAPSSDAMPKINHIRLRKTESQEQTPPIPNSSPILSFINSIANGVRRWAAALREVATLQEVYGVELTAGYTQQPRVDNWLAWTPEQIHTIFQVIERKAQSWNQIALSNQSWAPRDPGWIFRQLQGPIQIALDQVDFMHIVEEMSWSNQVFSEDIIDNATKNLSLLGLTTTPSMQGVYVYPVINGNAINVPLGTWGRAQPYVAQGATFVYPGPNGQMPTDLTSARVASEFPPTIIHITSGAMDHTNVNTVESPHLDIPPEILGGHELDHVWQENWKFDDDPIYDLYDTYSDAAFDTDPSMHLGMPPTGARSSHEPFEWLADAGANYSEGNFDQALSDQLKRQFIFEQTFWNLIDMKLGAYLEQLPEDQRRYECAPVCYL